MRGSVARALCLIAACASPAPAGAEAADWIVTQTGGARYETRSGTTTINGVARQGLVAAQTRAGARFLRFWEPGGFQATVVYGGRRLIDGRDLGDVTRKRGLRVTRDGKLLYLRSAKGPGSVVELVLDGRVLRRWPRRTPVRILQDDPEQVLVSVYDAAARAYRFLRIATRGGHAETDLGGLVGCALLGARARSDGLVLEAYCAPDRGSDVLFLDFATNRIVPVAATSADEMLGDRLARSQDAISVLAVEGDRAGRTAFHAIVGSLLRELGEPAARASDGAGRQSWGQSPRTETLAVLFRKTGHPLFAVLAQAAMRETLAQRNGVRGLDAPFNPPAAWASRIYSLDGRAPVSLLVNQAMIAGGLLRSCDALGEACPTALRREILATASALVAAYEPDFDAGAGLYRISFGAPFRFDGIEAPWNWQLAWAEVLDRVGEAQARPGLRRRAARIAEQFVTGWEGDERGALWRYWTPAYHRGWTLEEAVSLQMKERRAAPPRRFEDVAHAGIALQGLARLERVLEPADVERLHERLGALLGQGALPARDLDGAGPRSPRWTPASGWERFATAPMRARYSRRLPGAGSGARLLAYARLTPQDAPLSLSLSLRRCAPNGSGCVAARRWRYGSIGAFLAENPLFSIRRAPETRKAAR